MGISLQNMLDHHRSRHTKLLIGYLIFRHPGSACFEGLGHIPRRGALDYKSCNIGRKGVVCDRRHRSKQFSPNPKVLDIDIYFQQRIWTLDAIVNNETSKNCFRELIF